MYFLLILCTLLGVLCISAVTWYTVLLNKKGNVDNNIDIKFASSFTLWVLFVMITYVIIGLWGIFIDTSMKRVPGSSIHILVPWEAREILLPLMFALFGFTSSCLLMKYGVLYTRKIDVSSNKIRSSLIPRAYTGDNITMNYVKGILISTAVVYAVIGTIIFPLSRKSTQFSIDAHTLDMR